MLAVIGGCTDDPPSGPPPDTRNDTIPVPLTVNLKAVVGATPFAFDSVMTGESGAEYKVSLFRFYVSLAALIDTNGTEIPVQLVDTAGVPLRYGVQLVDYAKPESIVLRVLARRGAYRGIAFTIGVPGFDTQGHQLNHADASVLLAPLDVDADMYWGWKPGYIFMKLEGKSSVAKQWEPFYYHIGEDKRLMRITAPGTVVVRSDSTGHATLRVNVNRLFVTPDGRYRPNVIGELGDRVANSGPQVDTMSQNAAGSGFITLEP